VEVKAELAKGVVRAEIQMPERGAKKTLLRLRLPQGLKIESVDQGKLEGETIDLTGLSGKVAVVAKVKQ